MIVVLIAWLLAAILVDGAWNIVLVTFLLVLLAGAKSD